MICKKISQVMLAICFTWVVSLLFFPVNLRAARAPIIFEPQRIKNTSFLWSKTTIPISFESNMDLGDCELWVVPELQPYVNLSQYDFTIQKDQKYKFNLNIDIQNGAPTGIYDGTIHVRNNNKTIVRTLKVELNILGIEEFKEKLVLYSDNDDLNDLDGDGLLNNFELHAMNLQTFPDLADSDGDGVLDGQEDNDLDGLTNFEEQLNGTNPLRDDSDNDGLTDYTEINELLTNPLLKDSDNDKLEDIDELLLGTDPANPDSNNNGILDGDEIYTTTTKSEDSSIEIEITGQGSIAKQVNISHVESHGLFALDDGTVLPPILPIEITSEKSFDHAIIKFFLTPEILISYDVNNLKIVHFDETLNTFVPLANQGVNLAENYIWAETTHFSIFAVIDETILNALFNEPFNGNTRGNGEFIDIVFCLDSSGSMSWYDPSGIRKSASKTLIDALSADDQVAVVDFDNSVRTWQILTTDKAAAKRGIDKVNSSGGTNIGAGVARSIQEILTRGLYGNKLIILLTDGQGSYNSTYTQQAANNDIVIHTIGLGSGVNRSLLAEIASGTGGNYYQVSNASQLTEVFDDIKEQTQDSDGDGLPDFAEINGMRTGIGFPIFTDPYFEDSDGDGLTDGEEMGAVLNNAFFGGDYYLMISNPNLADSDNDQVNDYDEVKGLHTYPNDDNYPIDYSHKNGTNPMKKDSDGDNLSDYYDRYPNQWDWYGSFRKGDIIVVGHNEAYMSSHNWDWEARLAMEPWSHAVMYMGNERTIDAHPENRTDDPPDHHIGTSWRSIHSFLHNSGYDSIAFLKVKDEDDETAGRAGDEAKTFLGSDFEYPGLGEFESSFGSDDELYCAELIQKSWKSEGVDLRRAHLSLFPFVRPKDIYNDWATGVLNELEVMPHQRP